MSSSGKALLYASARSRKKDKQFCHFSIDGKRLCHLFHRWKPFSAASIRWKRQYKYCCTDEHECSIGPVGDTTVNYTAKQSYKPVDLHNTSTVELRRLAESESGGACVAGCRPRGICGEECPTHGLPPLVHVREHPTVLRASIFHTCRRPSK